jgi:hypothetical protein
MVAQQALKLYEPVHDDKLDDSTYKSDSSHPPRRHSKGFLQLVKVMIDRFKVRGTNSPMQWMLNLRTYDLEMHRHAHDDVHQLAKIEHR